MVRKFENGWAVHYELARFCCLLHRVEEEKAWFGKAIDLVGDAGNKKRFKLMALEEADSPKGWLFKAQSLEKWEQFWDVYEALSHAVTLFPTHERTIQHLLSACIALNLSDEVKRWTDRLSEVKGKAGR